MKDAIRVLLINPWDIGIVPPPSIGYLQGALKSWKPGTIDVVAKDLQSAIADTSHYDIVAVSFHSFSVKYAKMIRERFSRNVLVCGGHHPSAMPEQMLSIGYDHVVVGEGESAMIDIIRGNSYKIIAKTPNYFSSIDGLPFPDYTGLKYEGSMGLPVISSRGCPYKCNFCASSDFWNHRYVMRNAENVLTEIDIIIRKGIKTWIFYDDNFTANRKRVLEICSHLDGSIKWQCTSRAEVLDDDLCRELFRAGCWRIYLGIESLSQDALDRCGKQTTVKKILKGVAAAENAGIQTMSLFLVGLPGDTIENIWETVDNKKRSRIREYGTNIAWILPGTKIYQKAKEYGFNDDIYLTSGAPFYTYEHPKDILNEWASLI